MSAHRVSSFQKVLKDERGQMLPVIAVMLSVVLLGFVGFVVDVGRAYIGYRQLQSATDASVLAAAQALPNFTNATAAATSYGGAAGSLNAISGLTNVAMPSGYPLPECLTTLKNEGMACVTLIGGTGGATANAIQVKQTATVKMTFGALLGFKNITLTATATAAMRGAVAAPYNVAIVVDTTSSMTSTDTDKNCNDTRINCALSGIQTLLQTLDPCAASGCGTVSNGNVAHPVDTVSIFAFPNITTATVADDYNCSGTTPAITPYTFPSATAVTYTPVTSTYQVIGYDSDYRSSNSATTLNSASNIAAAVGQGPSTTVTTKHGHTTTTTTTPCPPMQAVGGQGTYYAGAIYAAQDSLVAAHAANTLSQNVMIILSDGDSNATSSAMPGASTTSGTYPSTKNQCAQAVAAAAAAKLAGTKIYTVAYGSPSSGCSTDTSGITPCQVMLDMAHDPSTFYSDYTASGGTNTCVSSSQPTTDLNQIFTEIAGDLTLARLIPDGTT